MLNFFKEKISPVVAFLFILTFGIFCIFLMNKVFADFSRNEILISSYDEELAKIERQ